jgi:hypothetical protein
MITAVPAITAAFAIRKVNLMSTPYDGSWGKDVTCATCVVLVLLPLLYENFPHAYASEISHVNGPTERRPLQQTHKAIHQLMHSNFLSLLAP